MYRLVAADTVLLLLLLCTPLRAASASSPYSHPVPSSTDVRSTEITDSLTALLDAGRAAHAAMQFNLADTLLSSALSLVESHNDSTDTDLTGPLSALGQLYADWCRYEEAEQFSRRAMQIMESRYGDQDLRTAEACAELAEILHSQGEYATAEKMNRSVLRLRERKLSLSHPRVAQSLISLAKQVHQRRCFSDAESLCRRALAIYERDSTIAPLELADCITMLATSLRGRGEYVAADSLYRRALTIAERERGSSHLQTIRRLNDLSALYVNIRRWDEADSCAQAALTAARAVLPEDHVETSRSLLYLGAVASAHEQYETAPRYLESALSIRRHVFNASHPYIASALSFLASNEYLRSEYARSMEFSLAAAEIKIQNYIKNSAHLSDYETVIFELDVFYTVSGLLSGYVKLQNPTPEWTERVADLIVKTKGAVPEDLLGRQQSRMRSDDRDVQVALGELKRIRAEKSRLFFDPDYNVQTGVPSAFDSLVNREAELDAVMSEWDIEYRRSRIRESVTARSVAAALPQSTVLVEYFAFTHFDQTPLASETTRLLAVVIDSSGVRGIRDLGNADAITPTVREYQNLIASEHTAARKAHLADCRADSNCLRILYERLWRPLADLIGDKPTVYVAADGTLNFVSFATLMDSVGEFVIERHVIHYETSARALLRDPAPSLDSKQLLIIGNPDFDASANSRLAALGTDGIPATAPIPGPLALRNIRADCGELLALNAASLPGTAREVKAVADLWTQRRGTVSAFTGPAASEDVFLRSAQGSSVIHLATHGFYLPPECQEAPPADLTWEPNAFLHCGLLLAGANLHGAGAERASVTDGIVTAAEITSLDLQNTRVVVLSACESGLGDAARGQGVFGLRMAFFLAGARSIVCSLWPISDQATIRLMEDLYSNSEQTTPELLRSYALEAINHAREQGQFPDPFTWGAFISIGDVQPPSPNR